MLQVLDDWLRLEDQESVTELMELVIRLNENSPRAFFVLALLIGGTLLDPFFGPSDIQSIFL